MIIGAGFISLYYTYFRILSARTAGVEAQKLASRVFEELSDFAHGVDDSFVSVTQLRDSVLRDEFSSARRQRLWGRVEKLVEQNANVRTKVGSLGSGDVGRGWRWIGSEGSSGSRRQSAAFNRTPAVEEVNGHITPSAGYSDQSDFKRWREVEEPKF
jgi:Man1-Src1p-like protein